MQEDHSRQCITALVCEVPAAAEGSPVDRQGNGMEARALRLAWCL